MVGRLSQIAEKHGASIPQVAISWILVKPHVSAVLVGASTIDQLRDNLGVAHVELGKDDTVELDNLTAVAAGYPAWMQPMGRDQKISDGLG